MKFLAMSIPDVILIEPRVFSDSRGFFCERWTARDFAEGAINQERTRAGNRLAIGTHTRYARKGQDRPAFPAGRNLPVR